MALLPQTTNTISCGYDCRAPKAIAVASDSDRQPSQYFVYTIADGKLVGLGASHPTSGRPNGPA